MLKVHFSGKSPSDFTPSCSWERNLRTFKRIILAIVYKCCFKYCHLRGLTYTFIRFSRPFQSCFAVPEPLRRRARADLICPQSFRHSRPVTSANYRPPITELWFQNGRPLASLCYYFDYCALRDSNKTNYCKIV